MTITVNGVALGASPSLVSGIDGARLAAGIAGRVYAASDTGALYVDTGTRWLVAPSGPDKLGLVGWNAGNLRSVYSQPGNNFLFPMSMAAAFYYPALDGGGAPQRIIATFGNGVGGGWQFSMNPGGQPPNTILFYANTGGSAITPALAAGNTPHKVAFSATEVAADVHIRHSLDGGAVVTDVIPGAAGLYVPPAALDTFVLGNSVGGGLPLQTDFGLAAFSLLNQSLTDDQLIALTSTPSDYRLNMPAGLTENLWLRTALQRATPIGGLLSGGASTRLFSLQGTLSLREY